MLPQSNDEFFSSTENSSSNNNNNNNKGNIGKSNFSFREIFSILPDELTGEIFQHLSMTHLIFSVSSVCRSWREISFPIILKRYQYYVELVGKDLNNCKKYSNLFQSTMGRNFIRTMFKEHVYDLATRLIEETTLGEIRTQNLSKSITMDFTDKDFAWFESELNMLQDYTELFEGLICKSGAELCKVKVSNNSKDEETKKSVEEKKSGVMNSVFSYLSSFFKNNSSAAADPEKKPNKPMIRDGRKSFKVIMLGDCYVGKTSTLECAVKNMNCNQKEEMPTIGASFLKQSYKINPKSAIIDLEIWDYSGPERYSTLAPIYFRGSHIAFAMFDLSNSSLTLDRLDRLIKDLEDHNPMEVVLVGNKSDLVPENKRIDRKRSQKLAFEKLEGALYVEITNTDIKHAHSLLVYSSIIMHLKYKHSE